MGKFLVNSCLTRGNFWWIPLTFWGKHLVNSSHTIKFFNNLLPTPLSFLGTFWWIPASQYVFGSLLSINLSFWWIPAFLLSFSRTFWTQPKVLGNSSLTIKFFKNFLHTTLSCYGNILVNSCLTINCLGKLLPTALSFWWIPALLLSF